MDFISGQLIDHHGLPDDLMCGVLVPPLMINFGMVVRHWYGAVIITESLAANNEYR